MTSTDNERGLKNSQRVTLSSGNTATPSVNFVLDGLQQKPTDARGFDWLSFYQSCCGRIQGNKDPAGHGSFSNSDYLRAKEGSDALETSLTITKSSLEDFVGMFI